MCSYEHKTMSLPQTVNQSNCILYAYYIPYDYICQICTNFVWPVRQNVPVIFSKVHRFNLNE